jgi:VWFA-related protein
LFLVAAGGGAAAQTPASAGGHRFEVTSQLVVLDVVVTDKHGHVVSNLGKNDFQVFEDKAPQRVLSLESTNLQARAASLPVNSTEDVDKREPDAPVNIIVLDEINTLFEDEAFVRYSLKKYLAAQPDTLAGPTMLVAVSLSHFMVLRDYTTSKSEILSALDHHLAAYPWHVRSGGWEGEQLNAAFSALTMVAEATAGHHGHKNMIWVGRGIPSIDMTRLPVDVESMLRASIAACANRLRDARVTLYSIDPQGLTITEPPTDGDGFMVDDPFGGQADFNTMAVATGGKVFIGRNDVDNLIATSILYGESFYTLTYKPATISENAKPFRNIRVVMNDSSLTATTREGYYVGAPVVAPVKNANGKFSNGLRFDLTAAAASMMVYDGVTLAVTRDAASPDAFRVDLLASEIPWHRDGAVGPTAPIMLLVESFDQKGRMLKRIVDAYNLHLPPALTGILPASQRVSMVANIPTGPPAARVRFVVRINDNGKVGAENFFLVESKLPAGPATGTSHPN